MATRAPAKSLTERTTGRIFHIQSNRRPLRARPGSRRPHCCPTPDSVSGCPPGLSSSPGCSVGDVDPANDGQMGERTPPCVSSLLSLSSLPPTLEQRARMCVTSPLWHRAMECDSQRRLGTDASKRTGDWSQDHRPQDSALGPGWLPRREL